jgi:hypothetical protein
MGNILNLWELKAMKIDGPGHEKKDFKPMLSKFCPEGPSAAVANRTGIFPSGGWN